MVVVMWSFSKSEWVTRKTHVMSYVAVMVSSGGLR